MSPIMKKETLYYKQILSLLVVLAVITVSGCLGLLWLRQKIELTAQATRDLEFEITKEERRLQFVDNRIAGIHQPQYLEKQIARHGLNLRPPRADQIVYMDGYPQYQPESPAEEAYAGDSIGLHNHGTINVGDTFTEGERLTFQGIPDFAPELFRRAVLKDPLRLKQLRKGLEQLCEEGATQLFCPLRNNNLILGAVGPLQFDVVAFRLRNEYGVECIFESVPVNRARWVECDDPKIFAEFKRKAHDNLALDHKQQLVYIAPSQVNLSLTQERWPDVTFSDTRDHADWA